MGEIYFSDLTAANRARQIDWAKEGNPITPREFRALELAGEVGEALNVIKKLIREVNGWRGSRATLGELAAELADVMIVLDLLQIECNLHRDPMFFVSEYETLYDLSLSLQRAVGRICARVLEARDLSRPVALAKYITARIAAEYGINLADAIRDKFNATSVKNGFPQRIDYSGERLG